MLARLTPGFAEAALWIAWLAYWGYASFGVARAEWTESRISRLAHVVPLCAAAILLSAGSARLGPLGRRWLPETAAWGWAGALVTAAGLAFAVWARLHLGRNWSAEVQLKEGHRLIRSGPYALARHPIYTGLLVGFLGAAIAVGELRGPAALALAFAAFLVKSRREEALMISRFGAEYEAYRREVKALIPFVF
jgi:protein-S-isoprenylcysteine O-methyltransferase Ste14